MVIDPKDLLSGADVANLLGMSPLTLVQWRYEGRGPAYVKVGRRCFYRREDIGKWLGQHRHEPGGTVAA